jgi:hypothetical protein
MPIATLQQIRATLEAAQSLAGRPDAQAMPELDPTCGRRVLGRTELASTGSARELSTPRNVTGLVSQERPDVIARYDTTVTPPVGYAVVPISAIRAPKRIGYQAIGPRAEIPALHTAEVRRTAPPLSEQQRGRVAREPRRPRPPRAARDPRPPRKRRLFLGAFAPRRSRRGRVPRNRRTPRPPRAPRAPRASKTKGREIPGICRVQCGGRPGACWNTGVCISGFVPYPAQIGACCFPRSIKCMI